MRSSPYARRHACSLLRVSQFEKGRETPFERLEQNSSLPLGRAVSEHTGARVVGRSIESIDHPILTARGLKLEQDQAVERDNGARASSVRRTLGLPFMKAP